MYEEQLRRAIQTIRQLRTELDEAREASREPIAIVGIGCRLPGGADSPEAFARLLEAGYDAVRETPSERWSNEIWYDADPDAPGKLNTRWGAFLDGLEDFDPAFFDLSEREVAEMDPQQRLLLETSWEALERAAIAPASLSGTRTGVFVGINGAEYYQRGIEDPGTITAHTLSGGVASAAAGRIAYQLGLNGPAVAVDTACSSSLAAVHQACRSLRAGESDLALAGGVYVVLEPNLSVGLSRLRMLAPDGRCKPFDARADGFVQGEGAGMIVLKRLRDARADGDPILAVVRGSAMNQDGRSVSLTAPSRAAQKRVIMDALADADIAPDSVGYVETHGTGTALGDPIECHALADAFGDHAGRPLVLGALKSNIGHLGPAAGIAGLIKAVLAIGSGRIPQNLHFERLNPSIDTGALQLDFPLTPVTFPEIDGRRIAGVSSFGFAGTNVHVVLEDAEASQAGAPPPSDPTLALLVFSARTESALQETVRRMECLLEGEADFAAVCRSAALGRNGFEHRLAIVAQSSHEARGRLRLAAPRRALSRPRLALALGDRDDPAPLWLQQAGVAPYAFLRAGDTATPADLPLGVPVIEAEDPTAAADLAELGVEVVVCGHGAEVSAELPGLAILRTASTDEQSRLRLLGDLFELGFSPDPAAFTTPGRRLALPVTPFERHRCWRERRVPVRAPAGLPGEPIEGPLPGHQFRLTTGLTRHPFLTDHRVDGKALVPGAFQILCMLRVVQTTKQDRPRLPTALQNIAFPHPLVLPESGDIDVWTAIDGEGSLRLASRSVGGDWLNHAQAEIADVGGMLEGFEIGEQHDFEVMDGATWRSELGGLGITVGPAFSGLVALRRGEREAVADILPVDGRIMLDGAMHPAFLDACLQTAGGALPRSLRNKTLLPIGIDRIVIAENPVGPVRVHARCREAGSVAVIDLAIMDERGRLLARIDGLGVRALHAEPRGGDLKDLFYRSSWEEQAAEASLEPGRRLFLADADTDAAMLVGLLGTSACVASPDQDIAGLLERCGGADHIVFCAGAASHDLPNRALALASFAAGCENPPRITFAAHGAISPIIEALAGLSATLALEQPATHCRFVIADTLEALVAETLVLGEDDRVRRAGGVRSVFRLVPMQVRASAPPPLTGTALVTGGFGGLGRALAGWLLERGAEAVVLVGRHPDFSFSDDLGRKTGRRVRALAADVAERGQVEQVMAAIGDLPPLTAIYHAAGAQAPGMLASLMPEHFRGAVNAKALGATALDEATRNGDLAEFVMISSVASLLGAAGQGGYAPANAVLDALARHRREAGLPGTSILLGRLAGAGMADALGEGARERVDALGILPVEIDTALDAIGAALAEGLVDPVVARIDWRAYAARHPAGRLPPSLRGMTEPAAAETWESPAAPDGVRDLAGTILDEIRLVVGVGAGREIDEKRTLVQLGFDSLMAIELRNRLRRRCGQAPSIGELLGGATVGEVVAGCARSAGSAQENARESGQEWEDLVL